MIKAWLSFGDINDGSRSMGASICDQHGGLEH